MTPPSACECVNEWVNVGALLSSALSGHWLEKRGINAVKGGKKKKRTNKSGVRLFVRVCVSQTLPYDWLKDSLGSMHPGWHNSLSDEVGMSLVKSRTSAVGNQRVYHPSTASDRLLAGGNTLHVRDRQIKVKVVT